MGAVAARLADDLEAGRSLSDAMRAQKGAFSKAEVCLVEGGERAGILDRVLVLIAEAVWRCPECGCWQAPSG
jgi:type II secretory pathway component PulF